MRRTPWVFGAAAAGVVVLVAPAVGQGRADPASLKWSRSRGGPTISSYDFGAVESGSSVSRWFRLGGPGSTKSGKLAIGLSGSSAFSMDSDRCTGKSIGKKLSCWVRVAYRPLEDPASDGAALTATGASGVAVCLSLIGGSAHPSGSLYWAGYDSGKVDKLPHAGGCVTTLASGQGVATAVAVDSTHVYWGAPPTVNKVPLGGGSATTLARGQYYPGSLAVDRKYVYWGVLNGPDGTPGTVDKVPIGGGKVTTLATGQSPEAVAVHGSHVYWVNGGDGTVNEVPVGGGSVTTLASGQSYPVSVAVDATHVYWVNVPDGTVNEVPLGGGSVTTLASGQLGADAVAVDGTHVYWTNLGTVKEVPLTGGNVITLAHGQGEIRSLAAGP
jgi:hypothetical protein